MFLILKCNDETIKQFFFGTNYCSKPADKVFESMVIRSPIIFYLTLYITSMFQMLMNVIARTPVEAQICAPIHSARLGVPVCKVSS